MPNHTLGTVWLQFTCAKPYSRYSLAGGAVTQMSIERKDNLLQNQRILNLLSNTNGKEIPLINKDWLLIINCELLLVPASIFELLSCQEQRSSLRTCF